jgi:hypothetical protein
VLNLIFFSSSTTRSTIVTSLKQPHGHTESRTAYTPR